MAIICEGDNLPDTIPSTVIHESRPLIAIIVVFGMAFIFNKFIGMFSPKLSDALTARTDQASDTGKLVHMRRMETYLGIGLTGLRLVLILAAFYITWRVINPGSAPIALVGASAIIIVVIGATVGPLLRDLTYGIIMIAERWYHVGDHINVLPFGEVSGVVESMTLRSTKLRSLNGEAVWMHNQHIQGVRVAPRGVRTIAVDAFVNDPIRGRAIMETAIQALPTGPTMIAGPLAIEEVEQLGAGVWRVTAIGQTAPGREWMIEDMAVKTISRYDKDTDEQNVIVHGPIVRYADATAERRFRRSVRAKRPTKK